MSISFSINQRITLLAGCCLLAVVTLLVGTSLYRMQRSSESVWVDSNQMLNDSARQALSALGESQVLNIQRLFADAYRYGQGVVRELQLLQDLGAQAANLPPEQLRLKLLDRTREALVAFPDLLGLYVVFEPETLSPTDEPFRNRPDLGSNEIGRIAFYWTQGEPGQPVLEVMGEKVMRNATPGEDGQPYNSWYTCPRDKKAICLLNPYLDKANGVETLMTSIAYPILQDGNVVAVMGLDITLEKLQALSLVASQQLPGGQGQLSIVSPSGLLAAHSAAADAIGQPLATVMAEHAADLLRVQRDGTPRLRLVSHQEGDQLQRVHPFQPIPGAPLWSVIQTPRKPRCWSLPGY